MAALPQPPKASNQEGEGLPPQEDTKERVEAGETEGTGLIEQPDFLTCSQCQNHS